MIGFAKGCILLLIINSCYATNDDLDSKLQKTIAQMRTEYGISAISLSIALPMQASINNYTSGTLGLQDKTTVKPDNLYQVGSITKNFTAAIILQLVENKKIGLDDKLGKYLSEYPLWKSITIWQLLNHTSGLYDYIDSPNWWPYVANHRDKIWQPKELLDISYKHAPYFVPGQGWHYSNTNYVLAGLVIEKVSGKSLDVNMQELLQKAKLNNSYYLPYPYPNIILAKMVHGYFKRVIPANTRVWDTRVWEAGIHTLEKQFISQKSYDQTTINGSWGLGAAALVSTPEQMVMWVRKLFSGEIISQQSLNIMQRSVNISNGQYTSNLEQATYGLGMFSINTPEGIIWFTPGLTPGYRSLWAYMPCDGIIFEYSVGNSLVGQKNFHKQMLRNIIQTLTSSKIVQKQIETYRQTTTIPTYCSTKPAKIWEFIKL